MDIFNQHHHTGLCRMRSFRSFLPWDSVLALSLLSTEDAVLEKIARAAGAAIMRR